VQSAVIVAGGFTKDKNVSKSCEKFKLSANKWSSVASLNKPRRYAAAATVDDVVFVFGGRDARDDVEQYDAAADTWTLLTYTMPVGRQSLAVACVNSSVYLLGGYNYNLEQIESTDCLKPDKSGKWCTKAQLPVACAFLSAVSHSVSDEELFQFLLPLL
jgi:N-acetylneuraminic acid mutarotase